MKFICVLALVHLTYLPTYIRVSCIAIPQLPSPTWRHHNTCRFTQGCSDQEHTIHTVHPCEFNNTVRNILALPIQSPESYFVVTHHPWPPTRHFQWLSNSDSDITSYTWVEVCKVLRSEPHHLYPLLIPSCDHQPSWRNQDSADSSCTAVEWGTDDVSVH